MVESATKAIKVNCSEHLLWYFIVIINTRNELASLAHFFKALRVVHTATITVCRNVQVVDHILLHTTNR